MIDKRSVSTGIVRSGMMDSPDSWSERSLSEARRLKIETKPVIGSAKTSLPGTDMTTAHHIHRTLTLRELCSGWIHYIPDWPCCSAWYATHHDTGDAASMVR